MAFEFRCTEKGGEITRKVRLLDRGNLQYLLAVVDKCQQVSNFLDPANPVGLFLAVENTFFEVDDVGLLAVIPYNTELSHVHITFWDGRLRGREKLCRTMADWVSQISHRQLFTAIPQDRSILLAFCKRVGFMFQGIQDGSAFLTYPNYPE